MRKSAVTVATVLALVAAGYAVAAPAGRPSSIPLASRVGLGRASSETLLVQMMGQGGMNGDGMMGQDGMTGHGMMGRGTGPGYRNEPAPPAPRGGGSSYGSRVYASRCAMCHSLRPGRGKADGPDLYGVFGRRAGSLPGYDYSEAMRQAGRSGVVWNTQTLDAFLADPQSDIPGDKMPFPGIANETERQAVISYLARATR